MKQGTEGEEQKSPENSLREAVTVEAEGHTSVISRASSPPENWYKDKSPAVAIAALAQHLVERRGVLERLRKTEERLEEALAALGEAVTTADLFAALAKIFGESPSAQTREARADRRAEGAELGRVEGVDR